MSLRYEPDHSSVSRPLSRPNDHVLPPGKCRNAYGGWRAVPAGHRDVCLLSGGLSLASPPRSHGGVGNKRNTRGASPACPPSCSHGAARNQRRDRGASRARASPPACTPPCSHGGAGNKQNTSGASPSCTPSCSYGAGGLHRRHVGAGCGCGWQRGWGGKR